MSYSQIAATTQEATDSPRDVIVIHGERDSPMLIPLRFRLMADGTSTTLILKHLLVVLQRYAVPLSKRPSSSLERIIVAWMTLRPGVVLAAPAGLAVRVEAVPFPGVLGKPFPRKKRPTSWAPFEFFHVSSTGIGDDLSSHLEVLVVVGAPRFELGQDQPCEG